STVATSTTRPSTCVAIPLRLPMGRRAWQKAPCRPPRLWRAMRSLFKCSSATLTETSC
ncbi:unnamed protein product, partial [Durusdinium trenchii]